MIRTFALAAALAISGATFAQTSLSLEQALDYA
jgi:hypothetical protein